jgi:hypothetical protein
MSASEQILRNCGVKKGGFGGISVWHAVCKWLKPKHAESLLYGPVNTTKTQQKSEKMKTNRWLVMASTALMCLGASTLMAQNNGGNGGGRPGRGNFDPAQMQQRMMDRYKEVLEVTDDTEWDALKPMVQKAMEARMASFAGGMGRGMFGRNRGGNNGGDQGQQTQRQNPFGQSSPEADALQKAIDAKAPKAEIKAALAKYVEARKAKQADLEKAQADLRKVLTSRQEAIATLNGLL